MAYDREKDNAKRLASVLRQYALDKRAVKGLAYYLNYEENQLAEDMEAVEAYLKRLEKEVGVKNG